MDAGEAFEPLGISLGLIPLVGLQRARQSEKIVARSESC
jgi:hypothetical protein